MAAPAAALLAQNLDLFALDTRDFRAPGVPDPDQPDPFNWTDEDERKPAAPAPAAPALELVPKRSLRDRISGVDLILETIEKLDDDEITPEMRDELSAQLIAELAGTRQKVDATAAVFAMYEGLEAAAAKEIARLQKRAARFERQRERLTDYVLATLEASKLPKIEGDISTLAARANPPSVVIDDLDAIPREFLRYAAPPPPPPATPDKKEIAKALKAKRGVPGARFAPTTYRLVRS